MDGCKTTFPFGVVYFQGRTVKLQVGSFGDWTGIWKNRWEAFETGFSALFGEFSGFIIWDGEGVGLETHMWNRPIFSLCSSPFSEKQYQKKKLSVFHTKTSIPLQGSPFDVYEVACIMNFQGCLFTPDGRGVYGPITRAVIRRFVNEIHGRVMDMTWIHIQLVKRPLVHQQWGRASIYLYRP